MAALVFDSNETVICLARLLVVPSHMVVFVFLAIVATAINVQLVVLVAGIIHNATDKHVGKCICQREASDSRLE